MNHNQFPGPETTPHERAVYPDGTANLVISQLGADVSLCAPGKFDVTSPDTTVGIQGTDSEGRFKAYVMNGGVLVRFTQGDDRSLQSDVLEMPVPLLEMFANRPFTVGARSARLGFKVDKVSALDKAHPYESTTTNKKNLLMHARDLIRAHYL